MNEQTANPLPDAPKEAAAYMLKVTQDLEAVLQEETNAVAMQDLMALEMLGTKKQNAVLAYEDAARAFQEKIPALKGKIDEATLDRLEEAQTSLGKTTETNLATLGKYHRAE